MVSQHDVKCLYKSFEVVCSLYHKQIGCLAADKTLSAEAERYYKKKNTIPRNIFALTSVQFLEPGSPSANNLKCFCSK